MSCLHWLVFFCLNFLSFSLLRTVRWASYPWFFLRWGCRLVKWCSPSICFVEWMHTFFIQVLLLFVFLSGSIKVNRLSDQILTTDIDLCTLSLSLFSLILPSLLAWNFLSWYRQSESMNQSQKSILERVGCNGCLCSLSCIHDKPPVKSARIKLCHWLFKTSQQILFKGALSYFFLIK